MPDNDEDLPFGLYERLITTGLKARLLRLDEARVRIVQEDLDPAEAHATLARHVEQVVALVASDTKGFRDILNGKLIVHFPPAFVGFTPKFERSG